MNLIHSRLSTLVIAQNLSVELWVWISNGYLGEKQGGENSEGNRETGEQGNRRDGGDGGDGGDGNRFIIGEEQTHMWQ